MPNNQPTELSADLLNDFYAECDEHLTLARQSLVALEQNPSEKESTAMLEKLFRSFHSLKGIISMVGIRSAEKLAHRTEDYLRELSRQKMRLTPEGVDLLAMSTQSLEQTVASFREKLPLPDLAKIMAEFDALIPVIKTGADEKEPVAPVANSELVEQKIEQAAAKGFQVWKFIFSPTPALNEKGINVNGIRERLAKTGEIIHAAPKVENGAMKFEFFVASADAPAGADDWKKSGITFEQASASAPGTSKPTTESASANLFVAPSQIVRVEMSKLDDLMRVTGDLVIQRARLDEQINRLGAKSNIDMQGLQEVSAGLNRHFRELRETVMHLRMVPIAEIFDRLPFIIRDLTRDTKKKVRLKIHGQQTQLDKFVVEKLKDPLLHLVRNAVSHGIEEPEVRVASGKPAEATLTLSAKAAGETVIIEIKDDGCGINRKEIISRAKKLDIALPDTLDDAALLDLICLPGFSTRDEADRASGRGVGMAVVQNALRELGGNFSLESNEGKGTHFTLRLPLTLLITDALIVSTGEQQFAIPQGSVEEVLHIEEADVKRMDRAELVSVRGAALPLVRLRGVFGFPVSDRKMPSVLVSETDRGRVGLVVDKILGQRQVVVRSLRDPLIHVPGVIGATELGDGRPLLILDPLILTKQSHARTETEIALATE